MISKIKEWILARRIAATARAYRKGWDWAAGELLLGGDDYELRCFVEDGYYHDGPNPYDDGALAALVKSRASATDTRKLNKHGHEAHCSLMWPATFNTADDHCDCAASMPSLQEQIKTLTDDRDAWKVAALDREAICKKVEIFLEGLVNHDLP